MYAGTALLSMVHPMFQETGADEYARAVRSPDSREAEARVGGVLRGGHVLGDWFFTCTGTGRAKVSLSSVRDLRYAPYE